jgi:sodium/bile acid cotransporter 7
LGLVGFAILGFTMPIQPSAAPAFSALVSGAVVILFLCHGLRLPKEAVVSGFGHWRLHITILAATYLVYPAAAFGLHAALPELLSVDLWIGIFFLSCVPSTVQSSIAFVSIAKGNVPAAIAQASASNLIGVVATPLLAACMIANLAGGISLAAIGNVCLQLLLPFAVGNLLRPLLFHYVEPHLGRIAMLDKATILLVVYSAFSAATISGIWSQLEGGEVLIILGMCIVLLAIGLSTSFKLGRWLGFEQADRTTIFYAGTLKSLATGVPIAQLILPSGVIGLALLPLMIFHQLQLLLCGWLASRTSNLGAPLKRTANV